MWDFVGYGVFLSDDGQKQFSMISIIARMAYSEFKMVLSGKSRTRQVVDVEATLSQNV